MRGWQVGVHASLCGRVGHPHSSWIGMEMGGIGMGSSLPAPNPSKPEPSSGFNFPPIIRPEHIYPYPKSALLRLGWGTEFFRIIAIPTRGPPPGAYGAWWNISHALMIRRRRGASDICFRRDLMLEFRLEERNTLVLLEIYFEHFWGHLNCDLGSNTNYFSQNESPITYTKDNKNLRGLANDAYIHGEKSIIL